MNIKLSQRQIVLKKMQSCGFDNNRREFMLLLLNNKISILVAENFYKKGINLRKYLFDKDLLTIKNIKEVVRKDEIQTLPTSQISYLKGV